jgi:hypothetical protein
MVTIKHSKYVTHNGFSMAKSVMRTRLTITSYAISSPIIFGLNAADKQNMLKWFQYVLLSPTALRNLFYNDKDSQWFHTYSEWVFVHLCFQYELHVHRFVICELPYLQYFSTLSHKRQEIRNILLEIKYLFLFSLQILSKDLLILRRTEKCMLTNEYCYSCNIQDITLMCYWKLKFLVSFLKK